MIGSVHLVKPGKLELILNAETMIGDQDGITIILNITLPVVKHVKKDEDRQYKVYLQNPKILILVQS